MPRFQQTPGFGEFCINTTVDHYGRLDILLGESSLRQQAKKGFEAPSRTARQGTLRTLSALSNIGVDSLPSHMDTTGYRFLAENRLEECC